MRLLSRLPTRALEFVRRCVPDRWTIIEIAAAGLLGAGVWEQWGRPFALMLWGALLLSLAVLRAALLARAQRGRD